MDQTVLRAVTLIAKAAFWESRRLTAEGKMTLLEP